MFLLGAVLLIYLLFRPKTWFYSHGLMVLWTLQEWIYYKQTTFLFYLRPLILFRNFLNTFSFFFFFSYFYFSCSSSSFCSPFPSPTSSSSSSLLLFFYLILLRYFLPFPLPPLLFLSFFSFRSFNLISPPLTFNRVSSSSSTYIFIFLSFFILYCSSSSLILLFILCPLRLRLFHTTVYSESERVKLATFCPSRPSVTSAWTWRDHSEELVLTIIPTVLLIFCKSWSSHT
jgi:hypothetical protein